MSGTIVRFTDAYIRHALCSPIVVKGLNLTINTADAWVITGPLGAGKTTVLDVSFPVYYLIEDWLNSLGYSWRKVSEERELAAPFLSKKGLAD